MWLACRQWGLTSLEMWLACRQRCLTLWSLLPVVDEGREKRDEMGEAIEMKRRRENMKWEKRGHCAGFYFYFFFIFFF
jgi:hypothetical protein